MLVLIRKLLLTCILLSLLPAAAFAAAPAAATTNTTPCPRPPAGSVVTPPPELFSSNGVLNVQLNYFTTVDSAGRTLLCFQTLDGTQSPTLHVQPATH